MLQPSINSNEAWARIQSRIIQFSPSSGLCPALSVAQCNRPSRNLHKSFPRKQLRFLRNSLRELELSHARLEDENAGVERRSCELIERPSGRSKYLQPIQALAQARVDYFDAVLDYNRAQFWLNRAIGQQP
jgi:hypothetical protein